MYKIFRPEYIFDNIYDITAEFIKSIGKSAIILDIDDTLVEHGVLDIPNTVNQWIYNMQKEGISVCVLSNNNGERVYDTLEKLGLKGICNGAKPLKSGYTKAAALMGKRAQQCVAIGDQIFTDIWGANNAKITSVLVHPVSNYPHWFFKIKRALEKPVLKKGAVIKSYEVKNNGCD